jgi:hypothetical protein
MEGQEGFVMSGVVDVKDFGAKGDGGNDDTVALKSAFQFAIAQKLPLYLPAGVYIVTDTPFWSHESTVGVHLYGAGLTLTKIISKNTNKPIMDFANSSFFQIRDMTLSSGTKTNAGIVLGQFDAVTNSFNAFVRSTFHNMICTNFDVGVYYNSGWITDFYSLKVTSCNTGVKLNGNSINFYGFMGENNGTAVDISNEQNGSNACISFFCGTIEYNTIGVRVRKSINVNMIGTYFENNQSAHVLAGTDAGDSVGALTIMGCRFANQNPLVFDRVQKLMIEECGDLPTIGQVKITDNVQMLTFRPVVANYDQSTTIDDFVEVWGRNRQTDFPIFHTDFSNVPIPNPANGEVSLDANGIITMQARKRGVITDYPSYISAKKAIRHTAAAGDTYNGVEFKINAGYVAGFDYATFVVSIYLPVGIPYLRRYSAVNYQDSSGTNQVMYLFDSHPVEASMRMLANKFLTTTIPIHMAKFKATVTDASKINSVSVVLQTNADNAAAGTEWFAIHSAELFPAKYVPHIYSDNRFGLFYPVETNTRSVRTSSVVLQGNTLPAPDSSQRGRMLYVYGAAGAADALYVCMKQADGSYKWVQQ